MKTKVWLMMGASLVLIGGIIFVGMMARLGWDFMKLSTTSYEENTYKIGEDYKNIAITTDTAEIVFLPAESTSVVCKELKNVKHTVTAQDGTLVVEIVDTRKWYEHIGIHFGTPEITVYLPAGDYGALTINSSTGDMTVPKELCFESVDIVGSTGKVTSCASVLGTAKIRTSTGEICVSDLTAGALELSVSTGKVEASKVNCEGDITVGVSTGKVELSEIGCENLSTHGSTGKVSMRGVIAKEKLSLKRSTGDIRFEGCDAGEIFVQTDTGSVTGTLLSDKVFLAQTDTGRVDVPKTAVGGKCEVITDTGNMILNVCEQDEKN